MKIRHIILATAFSMSMTTTAFAGTWKTGAEPNQNKWWYDYNNGTYASNGWHWIDGNNDNIAECYYFDVSGWLLTNTVTPDNYTVNENGAWTVNGVIQTQPAPSDNSNTTNQGNSSSKPSTNNGSTTNQNQGNNASSNNSGSTNQNSNTSGSQQQSDNTQQNQTQAPVEDDYHSEGYSTASSEEWEEYLKSRGKEVIDPADSEKYFEEHHGTGDPNNQGSDHGIVIH